MTILELRDRCVSDGLRSIEADEMITRHPTWLQGAREGFQIAATLRTPNDFTAKIIGLQKTLDKLRETEDLEQYWRLVYQQAQIEWVFNVLKVGWGYSTLSARAAQYVARLMR